MFFALFVGLGNYGTEYTDTLHNAGFITVDCISQQMGLGESWKEKFSGLYRTTEIHGYKVIFVKPQTYMNNSGTCVAQFKNFFKIQNNNIFVFHDDIDLQMGQIKIKTGGGNGGHNGLKSLDAYIGNDYHRIRFGVGRPQNKQDVSSFVLSSFKDEDLKQIKTISNLFCKNIIFLLEKQFSKLKNNI